MIVKIAVSAATYAIDKPYSYKIPEGMTLQPGQRVQLPFGRANKRTEGVVLTVETGNEEKLKAVERCLDEAPILSEHQLRLAAFLRERYFCTFYECLRVMLPAGLWFQARERISLTGDRSWKEKAIRKDGAAEVLVLLENLGGQAEESALRALIPDEETLSDVIAYLARKKWISAETEYLRRANDKTEKIAALAVSAEEAMEYASHRPKSAAMQKNVLELMCGVGSVSVKELCYFTGASTATVNRLEKLGYLTLTEQPVLRCREIRPAKLNGPLVLSPDQQRCYDGLAKQMAQENPGGRTPSGCDRLGKDFRLYQTHPNLSGNGQKHPASGAGNRPDAPAAGADDGLFRHSGGGAAQQPWGGGTVRPVEARPKRRRESGRRDPLGGVCPLYPRPDHSGRGTGAFL